MPSPPKKFKPATDEGLSDDQLATLVEEAGAPYVNFARAAKDAGLPEEATRRIIKRLAARHGPVIQELKRVNTKELLSTIEDRLARTLDFLDDEVLAKSNAKDLAIIAGILIEKRNLLRGEPTAILGTQERKSLDELLPVLVAEAKKRGLTVIDEAHMIDVSAAAAPVVDEPNPHQDPKPKVAPMSADSRKAYELGQKRESGEPL